MLKKHIFIALISFILFIIVRYIFKFDGLYGQDSYEYLHYTKALNHFIKTGTQPGDYFWPLYYPILGALLIFLNASFSLQLISIIAFSLSITYTIKTIQLINNNSKTAYTYTIIFLGLSPVFLRQGFLIMSDMLTVLFITLSFYNAILYFKVLKIKNLYFILTFALSAIMTRYAAAAVLFPLGIYTGFVLLKQKKHLLHAPFLILISLILLLPHFSIRQSNSANFLNHSWLVDWSFLNYFKSSFITQDGISNNVFPNIIYAFSSGFHPRYLALGILFLLVLLKIKSKLKYYSIFIVCYITYSLFLAGIPFQNSRFLILSFPILIVILSPAYHFLLSRITQPKRKQYILILIIILQTSLCVYGAIPSFKRNKLERTIAKEMQTYQNNTLYSFDIDITLKGRDLQFNYQNLWIKEYTSFKNEALVLFHPTKFKKQWNKKNPMINWNKLNSEHKLNIIKNLPNGWKLYKIQ